MKCDIYTIWQIFQNDLKSYINKRVTNKEDAYDILQTVLIKVTNYCTQKNNIRHIKPWLYKITQNTIIDYYKKLNPTNINTSLENIDLTIQQDYDEYIFEWLYKFIEMLPSKYAVPLYLSDIKELPQKEVASQMGLTLTATKSRIQRARKMLKEKFEECGKVEASESQFLSYNITKTCCIKN